MSFTLVLNSKNSFGANNNTYKYDFIQGNFIIPPDSEVMIANVQIPYSFYNITQSYNNNSFQFSFPTGSETFVTSTITIPDGFYTTTSLNYYLQQYMIANGYYLVNNAGQNVYYYTIQYNSYQYGNQLLGYLVPTSLPSGYSYPAGYTSSTIFGGNGFPTISRTPYLTILDNSFGTFLGYTAGNYPITDNSLTNYSGNSSITPVGSTVNSIIVRCSLVDNKVGIPMDILDSFTIGGVGFGNNINYSPNTAKWVKLSSGSFSNFYITFCDQNLSLLPALDNNIMVTLLFRLGKPKSSLTNE
jgi:hypothetical protein